MDSTQRSIIEWQCQQLLNRATNLLDKGEWDALVALYTENAELFRPSDPHNSIQGRAAILESFRARPPKTTCHVLANTEFNVINADQVVAFSRVWLASGPAGQGVVPTEGPIAIGSFSDTLVREADHWRIASRRGSMELKYS